MVNETIIDKTRAVEFSDWSSLLGYIADPPLCKAGEHAARKRSASSFDSYTSWEQAVTIAKDGWQYGADKTKAISEPLFDRISQLIERQDIVHDVEGMSIDVARYLDGEPECWQRWDTQIVEGSGVKIIKIGYNFCASAGISAETITARGAMVTALVELLEYAGNRVELWAVFSSRGVNDNYDNAKILVKSADQPLDMPRIAFALSHPAMLRRIQFEVMEHMSRDRWPNFSDSRGTPSDVDASQFDVYLQKMFSEDSRWQDQATAIKWTVDELEKQGITLHKGE